MAYLLPSDLLWWYTSELLQISNRLVATIGSRESSTGVLLFSTTTVYNDTLILQYFQWNPVVVCVGSRFFEAVTFLISIRHRLKIIDLRGQTSAHHPCLVLYFATSPLESITLLSRTMKLLLVAISILSAQSALAFSINNSGAARDQLRCFGTLDGKTIDGQFTPVNHMVLIKLDAKKSETSGGLLLASKVKVKKNEGTIVSTGPGRVNQESGVKFDMPVAPGEKVIYGQFSGTQLNLDGDAHVLIQDADILVKYTGESLNLATAQMLRDNVLVKVKNKQEESTGGILLAKSSTGKAKPTIGEVVKVGPGRYATNGKLMAMDVEEGDMIRFRDFTGNTVDIDGEEFSVVRMNDILAKF
jgi:chaperonin GroES